MIAGNWPLARRYSERMFDLALRANQHVELTPYVTNKTEHLRFDGGSLSQYDGDDPFHGGWKAPGKRPSAPKVEAAGGKLSARARRKP